MSTDTVEIFVAVFEREDEAGETLRDFQAMDKAGSIDLIDAAVVVRRADGKVEIRETADPGPGKWSVRGAIAGGVVGLIFPPTLIASAAVGAGAGAIWGKVRDKGIPDEELKAIGESMEPGTSSIIAVAQDRVLDQLETGLEGYRKISRHALSAEAAVAVTAEADKASEES